MRDPSHKTAGDGTCEFGGATCGAVEGWYAPLMGCSEVMATAAADRDVDVVSG